VPLACSFARLQKLSFCQRAFYFSYELNEDEFPSDIHQNISSINDSTEFHLAKFQLTRNYLKALFYRRDLGPFEVQRELAQQGLLHELDKFTIENIAKRSQSFRQSELYAKTDPTFVTQQELQSIVSFQVNDRQIHGNIDFMWYDQSGLNLACLASKQNHQAKINFMLCYALRETGAKPEKINIGLLHFQNEQWSCDWQETNWNSYQEYLDQILSFSPPKSLAEVKATDTLHKCNLCEYQQVCQDFSDCLDK
jgi:hypothetical protein